MRQKSLCEVEAEIMRLIAKGFTRRQISEALGRSRDSINGIIVRCRKRNGQPPKQDPLWDKAKDEEMIRLRRMGHAWKEIEQSLGLKSRQAENRARHLKIWYGVDVTPQNSVETRRPPKPKRPRKGPNCPRTWRPSEPPLPPRRAILDGSPGQEPRGCRYIAGELSEPGWSYCQQEQIDGSPYCAEHHALCTVPAPKPRDVAEAAD